MRSVYVFVINRVYCHINFLLKLKYVRASAQVDVKFLYILPKNILFLFYTPIFTKQPHQFVYFTHSFI